MFTLRRLVAAVAVLALVAGLFVSRSWLDEPWWQGIAGIAQIIAAALTIRAVQQSQHMIRQADQQRTEAEQARRAAVAPAWEVISADARVTDHTGANISLRNIGNGPARDVDRAITAADPAAASPGVPPEH